MILTLNICFHLFSLSYASTLFLFIMVICYHLFTHLKRRFSSIVLTVRKFTHSSHMTACIFNTRSNMCTEFRYKKALHIVSINYLRSFSTTLIIRYILLVFMPSPKKSTTVGGAKAQQTSTFVSILFSITNMFLIVYRLVVVVAVHLTSLKSKRHRVISIMKLSIRMYFICLLVMFYFTIYLEMRRYLMTWTP
jgi:hypothetical protein